MSSVSLQIETLDRDSVEDIRSFTGVVELGRQNDASEQLYAVRQLNFLEIQQYIDKQPANFKQSVSGQRISRYVVAAMNEDVISRHHALVYLIDDHQLSITNLSAHVMIRLGKQGDVMPGKTTIAKLPLRMTLGSAQGGRVLRASALLPIRGQTMRLEPPAPQDAPNIRRLEATAPLQKPDPSLPAPRLSHADASQIEDVIRWLHGALGVLQAATSSADFFQRAAQSIVDDVKCDRGAVLLLRNNEWLVEAYAQSSKARAKPNWRPSGSFLAQVLESKSTCWQSLDQETAPESLDNINMVVGAPIRNEAGEVLGVLYGECDFEKGQPIRNRLTRLEATLADILAGSVANGLARLEQEKVALAAEVRFDQFFTPELSQELTRNPDLLQGRDREVTLVFADIRGFSKISEKLGPALTMEWIGDIMNELSDCVLRHEGVLVDYLGDELMAMWGAPTDQPDHASRAARAALEMLGTLPKLNDRWRSRIEDPIRLGIGINTGVARVGNTGSRYKFKYGPLGHMVNLAARLQGATKYLRVPILMSEATMEKLSGGFLTRRLCSVRVINIQKPVSLYELSFPDQVEWTDKAYVYEKALKLFEEAAELPEDVRRVSGGLREAARELGNHLSQFPDDGPAMVLLARVVNVLADETAPFHAVWDLPGK